MTEVVGSDIPQGPEVKWYAGGTLVMEQRTATGVETSYTLADSAHAEYGSTICFKNGVGITHTEGHDSGAASETTGTNKINGISLTDTDVLEVWFVRISGTDESLVHVASCQDVKCDASASTKTAAVHGQATKLNSIGAIENSADLEEFYYNADLVNLAMGDYFEDVPAAGGYKWTNKFSGVKKIGALVGKRRDSTNAVIYKWILCGAQATGVGATFPTEDMYKRSCKFLVDYWVEVDLS